jgi:rare lipoprotein A
MGRRWFGVTIGLLVACLTYAGHIVTPLAAAPSRHSPTTRRQAEKLDRLRPIAPHGRRRVDDSGREEKGRASYYAGSFAYRKMADGRRLNPNSNVVASKTLPLGTTAAVTNLRNGRTATVTVQDRGPFVDDRVVDLSPKVARELDVGKRGVVPVVVKPIAVPQPNGAVKLGAGAADAPVQEVERDTKMTEALVGGRPTETASRR